MAMILGNYIDGRWLAARKGATFDKRNPADTRDIIGEFPASSASEVLVAVTAARRALPAWRGCSRTTIGNDMSSRSIEGDNPLYLPQAKIYDGGCALGPVIELNEGEPGPRLIRITIDRGGTTIFSGEISTSQMKRKAEDLARWLFRELHFPAGAFLFTGTGIVPPNDFTLNEGDLVAITIEGVGTLENTVTVNT